MHRQPTTKSALVSARFAVSVAKWTAPPPPPARQRCDKHLERWLGNDIFVTDGGDTIVDLANQGPDTVRSSVSYTLGANLENLVLLGSTAINGAGNTLSCVVAGNAAGNDYFVFNTIPNVATAASPTSTWRPTR